MSVEQQHKAYYDSIFQGKSYIDNRLAIQTAVSDFLAQAFFGKDFKRVVYTNPEYAFRKRIEALAHGVEENIFISSLELPFCSFYLDGAPKIIKTMSASEWSGYYDEEIEQQMHFWNTTQGCTVQFFFDRSDDATAAFEIAQGEMLAGAPIRYIQEVMWRNKTLKLPVFITIKDVTVGNDAFNESDWLEKSHMFALRLKLEVETARVHIHKGKNMVQLPFKWHATGTIDTWTEDTATEYYTQKCVLAWVKKALSIDCTEPSIPTKEAEEAAIDLTGLDLKEADDATKRLVQRSVPNEATIEVMEGFFKDNPNIAFNVLKYNPDKTTIDEHGEVTAWFDFVVKPATYKYWDYTEVYIPSRQKGKITVKNCKDRYVQIDGIHPNSVYTVYFIAHDISGNFTTIPIEFTTPVWKKEKLPAITEAMDPSELITTVEDKEEDAPTIRKGKGLIGLEF